MNFDDSEKDYFLHDFSQKTDSSSGRAELPAAASEETAADKSPSFDFGDTSGGSGAAERPRRKRRKKGWIWFFLIVFLILAATVAVRYFVPYVTESQTTGYVTLIEKRGIIFRTFEGEMVSESQLADKGHVYARDVYFSIPDEEMARRLQQYQGSGTPVTITCKRYFGTLPWRGASNNVMVSFTPRQN